MKNWYRCKNCDKYTDGDAKFCVYCGTKIEKENGFDASSADIGPTVVIDNKFLLSDRALTKKFIGEEIKKLKYKKLNNKDLRLKNNILIAIWAIISFICIIMFFFNEPIEICLGVEAVTVIAYIICSKVFFSAKNKIYKDAIENPDEEITVLIERMQNESKNTIPTLMKIIGIAMAIIIVPCIYFQSPRTFYVKEGNGYSLVKYSRGVKNTFEKEVIIPNTYNGKKVISIGNGAFKNTDIEKVQLPEGLEEIKSKAFYNCTSITKIEIPKTVTAIRGEAFAKCKSLRMVYLNEGLKEIRGGAFKECKALFKIDLPNSLEYLGGSAFSHCSYMSKITIPEKVTEINGQTFEYCTSLTTVDMHDNITSIHGEVFVNCTLLKDVVLPSKIKEIKGNTFENCKSLKSINIPEGVTRIGGHAFYGCKMLSSVTVPSTVKEIGSSAFRNCTLLKTIRVPKDAYINERAFKGSPTRIIKY